MKPERFQGIISLDGPDRYRHFVKAVVDREAAWGLHDDGWALAATDDGVEAFALWPEREFAEACADQQWSGYAPEPISLRELIDELAPRLQRDGMSIAVFPTPDDRGVVRDAQALVDDLEEEELEYAGQEDA